MVRKVALKYRKPKRLSCEMALKLLGEVDGITLRSVGKHKIVVLFECNGKEYEVISAVVGDVSGIIDHHITRHGLLIYLAGGKT